MISRKDFKNPWTYLWIISTILLYWFVLYHVWDPFTQLITGETEGKRHYHLLFVHNFWIIFPHILTSIIVAIVMPWQFLIFKVKFFRRQHKLLGYIFLISTCIATPTAFYLSYTSNNSFITSTGNAIAATGWCLAAWVAFYYIKKGNIEQHQKWMIRSFAFFMDASLLRLIYTEMELFNKAGSLVYDEESWLAWVITIVIVEILFVFDNAVKKHKRKKRSRSSKE